MGILLNRLNTLQFKGVGADSGFYRLEKRRQAMLDMPQMIQNWKEVCFHFVWLIAYKVLMLDIARSWSWMEEVAEIMAVILRVGCLFRFGRHCLSV
jgi:hypothetical protein